MTKIPKTKRREYGNTINYSLSNIVQDVRNLGVAKLKLSKMIFFFPKNILKIINQKRGKILKILEKEHQL